eukprot:TRINITY_DN47396_c0_g1_i2.p1 TRINITY_DN47396_c0_g1~~TRINITY_DN47396_c0_g1_i2.p1  ORF type:complete len:677 (+),score=107.86 TRINITY_DN47396_c0_g1_i2:114-2144(+)
MPGTTTCCAACFQGLFRRRSIEEKLQKGVAPLQRGLNAKASKALLPSDDAIKAQTYVSKSSETPLTPSAPPGDDKEKETKQSPQAATQGAAGPQLPAPDGTYLAQEAFSNILPDLFGEDSIYWTASREVSPAEFHLPTPRFGPQSKGVHPRRLDRSFSMNSDDDPSDDIEVGELPREPPTPASDLKAEFIGTELRASGTSTSQPIISPEAFRCPVPVVSPQKVVDPSGMQEAQAERLDGQPSRDASAMPSFPSQTPLPRVSLSSTSDTPPMSTSQDLLPADSPLPPIMAGSGPPMLLSEVGGPGLGEGLANVQHRQPFAELTQQATPVSPLDATVVGRFESAALQPPPPVSPRFVNSASATHQYIADREVSRQVREFVEACQSVRADIAAASTEFKAPPARAPAGFLLNGVDEECQPSDLHIHSSRLQQADPWGVITPPQTPTWSRPMTRMALPDEEDLEVLATPRPSLQMHSLHPRNSCLQRSPVRNKDYGRVEGKLPNPASVVPKLLLRQPLAMVSAEGSLPPLPPTSQAATMGPDSFEHIPAERTISRRWGGSAGSSGGGFSFGCFGPACASPCTRFRNVVTTITDTPMQAGMPQARCPACRLEMTFVDSSYTNEKWICASNWRCASIGAREERAFACARCAVHFCKPCVDKLQGELAAAAASKLTTLDERRW